MSRKSRDSRDDQRERDDDRDHRERDHREREPRERRRRGEKSSRPNSSLIWGAAIGGGLAVIGIVVLVVALSGGGQTPTVAKGPAQTVPQQPSSTPSSQPAPVLTLVPSKPAPVTQPVAPPKQESPKVQQAPVALVPIIDKRPPEPTFPAPAKPDRPYLVTDPSGHSANVKRCMFTPDGERVVTVSHDKTVRV